MLGQGGYFSDFCRKARDPDVAEACAQKHSLKKTLSAVQKAGKYLATTMRSLRETPDISLFSQAASAIDDSLRPGGGIYDDLNTAYEDIVALEPRIQAENDIIQQRINAAKQARDDRAADRKAARLHEKNTLRAAARAARAAENARVRQQPRSTRRSWVPWWGGRRRRRKTRRRRRKTRRRRRKTRRRRRKTRRRR